MLFDSLQWVSYAEIRNIYKILTSWQSKLQATCRIFNIFALHTLLIDGVTSGLVNKLLKNAPRNNNNSVDLHCRDV